jgi:hypothetical protein
VVSRDQVGKKLGKLPKLNQESPSVVSAFGSKNHHSADDRFSAPLAMLLPHMDDAAEQEGGVL